MHAAPPVRMSLAPDPAWRYFVTACAGAAAANLSAWIAAQAQWRGPETMAVALMAAVLACALAARALRRDGTGVGMLAWDGATWMWAPGHSQPAAGELRVMIDLGAWMLLRLVPTASAQRASWLTASRRQAAALWPLWRAAIFSRRPGSEPATAADPA